MFTSKHAIYAGVGGASLAEDVLWFVAAAAAAATDSKFPSVETKMATMGCIRAAHEKLRQVSGNWASNSHIWTQLPHPQPSEAWRANVSVVRGFYHSTCMQEGLNTVSVHIPLGSPSGF